MIREGDERKLTTWETIDYIGGGYVLQKQMMVRYVKKHTKHNDRFTEAVTKSVTDHWELEVDKYEDINGTLKGRVEGAEQQHRIVHISELAGVDMPEFVQDVEERSDRLK